MTLQEKVAKWFVESIGDPREPWHNGWYPDWALKKADAILAIVAEDRRELVEALEGAKGCLLCGTREQELKMVDDIDAALAKVEEEA